ncbi:putative F-box protein At1g32420 [Papaver somniferum]|uniref:putative F-box protein At1g32420 n=1 Tax=Papaver somniferum TaxID=3469 RepID=UPI000E6F9A52|nr:putative F-box protein At1g32420 [Papaver somniferum]
MGNKAKRHGSNDTRKSNKCSSSGNSKLVIGSNTSSSKREEEHEIIGQRKNKKMKMDNNGKAMGKCSDDKVKDGSSSIFDHYRILLEILSRLPIKSLMPFKCVSKHWQFSICQDQGLIDLHFSRSKQHCQDLFILVPRYTKVDPSDRRKIYAGRRSTNRTTVSKSENHSFRYDEILKPVNGLICFANHSLAAVRILNPSTRELTPWIATSLRENKKYNFIADHACGQDIRWDDFCEVFTVGENTWRYVDEKIPYSYDVKVSVYSNGFIYWGKQFIGVPEKINAFDVGQEKFKVIQVPQDIRDKCKNPPGGYWCGPFDGLIEVGGHLALLQRWTGNVVKLWICGDDTSTGNYSKWTEITMKLPFQWGRHGRFPYFHGVAGEDRIIIESYPAVTRDIKKVSLYSYDLKEKTSTKMPKSGVVTELVSASLYSKLASVSLIRSFASSLWPVGKC